jgi:hypothetical protein
MSHDPQKTPSEASGKEHHEDDVVVVPKGSSRTRFLMTALLAFLVLTTFTVSREVVDVFSGRNPAKTAYMRWKRPDGKTESMSRSDFAMVKRELTTVNAILTGGRRTKDSSDVQAAQHIILDELAKESGVEVTDQELGQQILRSFNGSKDLYEQALDVYKTTPTEFEPTLRSLMRIRRYLDMLASTYAAPEADGVVEQWKKAHKEYSLESVEIETGKLADEAKAACPDADGLKSWFDALPEAERNTFRTQMEAKVASEFAWFSLDPPTNPTRLLAKYPRPANENADEVAKTWYEANKDLLYRKPGTPPGKAKPEDYLPFEEVKEKAIAEGTANQSVNDWLIDMKFREAAGETIAFSNEGRAIGLAYRQEATPHTRAEWKTYGMGWVGQGPVDAMFGPNGVRLKLLPDVIVDKKALFVGRVLEKEENKVPEFSEIQDKVKEHWIQRKQGELAVAKLEALRAKLPTAPDPKDPSATAAVEPDEAKFQAAAQELGLEVHTHDTIDTSAALKAGSVTPQLLYLRQAAGRYGDTPGLVTKPEVSTDKTKAWLARIVGSREPDPKRMTPFEYQGARQMAGYEAQGKFFASTFGSNDYLKQRFGLDLESWRNESPDKDASNKP